MVKAGMVGCLLASGATTTIWRHWVGADKKCCNTGSEGSNILKSGISSGL